MSKTLVIVTHPNIEQSHVNKSWVEALKAHPDLYTVHEIYKLYPDGKIDVAAEQKLLESYDNIVLQFPMYWYSSPALLKQWQDDVLAYGWVYGSKGNALKGKKLGVAVSVGSPAEVYTKTGSVGAEVPVILLPFKLMANFVQTEWQPPFLLFGALSQTPETLKKSSEDYLAHLQKYFA